MPKVAQQVLSDFRSPCELLLKSSNLFACCQPASACLLSTCAHCGMCPAHNRTLPKPRLAPSQGTAGNAQGDLRGVFRGRDYCFISPMGVLESRGLLPRAAQLMAAGGWGPCSSAHVLNHYAVLPACFFQQAVPWLVFVCLFVCFVVCLFVFAAPVDIGHHCRNYTYFHLMSSFFSTTFA